MTEREYRLLALVANILLDMNAVHGDNYEALFRLLEEVEEERKTKAGE